VTISLLLFASRWQAAVINLFDHVIQLALSSWFVCWSPHHGIEVQ